MQEHQDSPDKTKPRRDAQRFDAPTRLYTSGHTKRGALIDPDKSQPVFMPDKRPLGGVRQDKGVLTTDRTASRRPAPARNSLRSLRTPTKTVCSQISFVHKHKTVPLQLWVDPLLKAEVQRVAQEEALSLSQVGATGLGEWVHQRLHDQHEALLYPVLRQVIRDELTAFGNRLVFFLMRIAFAAEQTRILVTNILDRMLKKDGVEPKVFNSLVDQSRMARRNIIARTPQIKSLLEEWEQSNTPDAEKARNKGEQLD